MLKNNVRVVSLLLLAVIAVAGAVMGVVFANQHGESEVRVSLLRHADGRVEAAVQQRGGNHEWSERQLPEHRFLPADSTGHWRNSSPVAVAAAHADDAMSEPDDAMSESDALYCVIHHGGAGDPFWDAFDTFAAASAAELGLSNLEIHAEPVAADQAAAIRDCIARGAAGIASSIPQLDALRDALLAVGGSGAILFTFNSGADAAGQVGSAMHYGLDDRAAGELAGREFNTAGRSGAVLCVMHEAANVGLEDRCSGLENTYNGSVVRVPLPEGSLTDPVAAGTAIGGAIVEHDADGVLVLNQQLIRTAVGAVQFLGRDTPVGTIGASGSSVLLVSGGQLLFSISDAATPQANHVILALKNIDGSPTARQLLGLTASQATSTVSTFSMLIRPVAVNQAYVDNLPEGWFEEVCALALQVAPDRAPSSCTQ